MTRYTLRTGTCLIVLFFLWCGNALYAQQDDGPFGLRWEMSKEDVENMRIRLCCEQVGTWGVRYEVNSRDFEKLPSRLGDEEKMYLYFGNNNKLLRIYVAMTKIGAENRYNQINILLDKKYQIVNKCSHKTDKDCDGYKEYASYKKDNVEVLITFKENLTYRDKIEIIFLHKKLFKQDNDTKNPF